MGKGLRSQEFYGQVSAEALDDSGHRLNREATWLLCNYVEAVLVQDEEAATLALCKLEELTGNEFYCRDVARTTKGAMEAGLTDARLSRFAAVTGVTEQEAQLFFFRAMVFA